MSQTEEFEAWAIDRGMDVGTLPQPRPYLAPETQAAHDAWMAADRKHHDGFSKDQKHHDGFSKDQARAWLAVATLLSELVPDWTKEGGNGMDCALDTIRELHAKARQFDDAKLHARFGPGPWLNVCQLLDELKPGWWREEGTVEQCALRTIKELHAKAQKAPPREMHSTLTMSQVEGPLAAWKWTVKLPSGMTWASSSAKTFDQAMASMMTTGAKKLAEADGHCSAGGNWLGRVEFVPTYRMGDKS